MVFSSIVFILFFFPLFLITYYLSPRMIRNYVLLVFSLVFYAWGAPEFVFFLIGSVFSNFYIVKEMYYAKSRINRKLLAGLSVAINLGLLIYFKYANFFVENFNFILNVMGAKEVYWTNIVLPIGISFFTFQSLTYTVDVYRNVHPPLKNPFNFLLYIIMFPQMIAGPIVRFQTIADQITGRRETNEDRLLGFYRFVIGLAKKVLIADVLGFQVDKIMALDYAGMDSATAWIGIVGFTFQIYFDFSGYSDMAIGIGRMIGFKFPENFNNPYIARSVTEFWRRWHITFSTFMRNYLYYPIGGSRVDTKRRLYFNLWFVFLVSGLWHGASWNFVIYGAFHGTFLVMERLFLIRVLDKIGKWPSILFTFMVIVVARVFFRVEGLDNAMIYLDRLFAFDFSNRTFPTDTYFNTMMIVATVLSFITAFKIGIKLETIIYETQLSAKKHLIYFCISICVLILIIASLSGSGFSPFIYFRF
ncbi:MAG: MBOAT family protein [Bacteroidetes bacterium]|nr:MBOAT family protein [Bacteroidota bacterium]